MTIRLSAQHQQQCLSLLQRASHDPDIEIVQQLQALWSGMGMICRVYSAALERTFIAKFIAPPVAFQHPRGWNTDISLQRKLRSYQVECAFYMHIAALTSPQCRVPVLHAQVQEDDCQLILLEDLDAAGFSVRHQTLDDAGLYQAIDWLAGFHGRFMGCSPNDLWEKGCYWHLDTRPDEWQAMPEGQLKDAAVALDAALHDARFVTLLHGDAKVANLCFQADGAGVAAVDFQYVGGGAGVKDLAYLLGCCLDADALFAGQEGYLQRYFSGLKQQCQGFHPDIPLDALEQEWRALYPLAWADFQRFLQGWAPKHWKINAYMQAMTDQALASL